LGNDKVAHCDLALCTRLTRITWISKLLGLGLFPASNIRSRHD
jgi:hypothetical protein